jgi:hypothetical protein
LHQRLWPRVVPPPAFEVKGFSPPGVFETDQLAVDPLAPRAEIVNLALDGLAPVASRMRRQGEIRLGLRETIVFAGSAGVGRLASHGITLILKTGLGGADARGRLPTGNLHLVTIALLQTLL